MTLKTKNAPFLFCFLILMYVAFAIANGLDWSFAADVRFTKEGLKLANPLLTASFHLIALILSYVLPPRLKHQIVYLCWKNPLPGSRAFTSLIDTDTRISRADLVSRYGELPTKPEEQNSLWYRIYKEKQSDDVVLNSHGRWLLFRDLLSTAILLFVPASCYTFWKSGMVVGSFYLILYLTLIFSLWISARNAGNRFACNVLAR